MWACISWSVMARDVPSLFDIIIVPSLDIIERSPIIIGFDDIQETASSDVSASVAMAASDFFMRFSLFIGCGGRGDGATAAGWCRRRCTSLPHRAQRDFCRSHPCWSAAEGSNPRAR